MTAPRPPHRIADALQAAYNEQYQNYLTHQGVYPHAPWWLPPLVAGLEHHMDALSQAIADVQTALGTITKAVTDGVAEIKNQAAAAAAVSTGVATGAISPADAATQLEAIAASLTTQAATLEGAIPVPAAPALVVDPPAPVA